jgi:uncharacterized protein (TIRG00374 family)
LLAVVAAWLSIRRVDWSALQAALAHPRPAFLALALAAVLSTTILKAARWHVLLRPCHARAGAPRLLRVLFVGQMANGLLPRLGDVARALLLGPRARGGATAVLGSILVEKALDGVLGLAILLGLALATPLPSWLRGPILGLAILTAFLLFLLAWAGTGRGGVHRLVSWLPIGLRARAERLLSGLFLGLGLFRAPARALLALGLSAAVWGLAALTNLLLLVALDIQAPGWSIWLVVVTGYAATFLPTVPAQVGVFEYAAVLSLTAAGVAPGPALAFALVLHLWVQGPPAILGPIAMAIEGLDWRALRLARRAYLEGEGVT